MCKIASISGIKKEDSERVWRFLATLASNMTPGNNDGMGYAAFDKDGFIFGERWLDNTVGTSRSINPKTGEYNNFGRMIRKANAKSVIVHTRAATRGNVNITNTHPFVDKNDVPTTALIHNGGISNHHDLTKKYSTCDSEVILHEYIKHNVNQSVSNIQKVANSLKGWYTCAVLTKDKENRPIVDLFTDGKRLSSYYIEEFDCRVYATSGLDIEQAARKHNLTIKNGSSMDIGDIVRIDALNGKTISVGKFDPFKKEKLALPVKTYQKTDYWSNIFKEYGVIE